MKERARRPWINWEMIQTDWWSSWLTIIHGIIAAIKNRRTYYWIQWKISRREPEVSIPLTTCDRYLSSMIFFSQLASLSGQLIICIISTIINCSLLGTMITNPFHISLRYQKRSRLNGRNTHRATEQRCYRLENQRDFDVILVIIVKHFPPTRRRHFKNDIVRSAMNPYSCFGSVSGGCEKGACLTG